jgi:hypothetical protein
VASVPKRPIVRRCVALDYPRIMYMLESSLKRN